MIALPVCVVEWEKKARKKLDKENRDQEDRNWATANTRLGSIRTVRCGGCGAMAVWSTKLERAVDVCAKCGSKEKRLYDRGDES